MRLYPQTMTRATAGHDVRIGYYYEDAYGTLPDAFSDVDGFDLVDLAPFGVDAEVGSAEGSNALQRVFEPGKRISIDLLEMIFDGSFSVNFTLTNPWWLKAVLGAPAETDNTGSTTYTYSVNRPLSFGIIEAYTPSNVQRVLKGCFVTQVTIDVSVEEEVSVSLEGAYADEELQKVSREDIPHVIEQPPITGEPMTFAEGSITVEGALESLVQSMSLDLTTNIDPVREMGSRVTIDFNEKTVEPDVDFTKILDADDEHGTLEEMYGGTSSPTENFDETDMVAVSMDFDNGEVAGEGIEHGSFTVSGTLPQSYDESGAGDPTADLEQTIQRMGLDIDATWETENEAPA